jgi:hypothetical protein
MGPAHQVESRANLARSPDTCKKSSAVFRENLTILDASDIHFWTPWCAANRDIVLLVFANLAFQHSHIMCVMFVITCVMLCFEMRITHHT